MFTGLVEATVPLVSMTPVQAGARLVAGSPGWVLGRGDSIAVLGACLSLVERRDPRDGAVLSCDERRGELVFDLSGETLVRTRLGRLRPGDLLNLERALKVGDRLDGHMVSGHVDGLGRVVELRPAGDGGWRATFEVHAGAERYLVDKGSITIDGISLTVVEPRGRRFDVAVVPITWEKTNLARLAPGDEVHVECDMVAKWIERLLPGRG